MKDETPSVCVQTEIRTQMVVICGPTRYQLYHIGAFVRIGVLLSMTVRVTVYSYVPFHLSVVTRVHSLASNVHLAVFRVLFRYVHPLHNCRGASVV